MNYVINSMNCVINSKNYMTLSPVRLRNFVFKEGAILLANYRSSIPIRVQEILAVNS